MPKLTPTWEKRALVLGEEFPFHHVAVPLGDLFLIAPRGDDDRAPFVEEMRPGEAFIEMLVNTYANYLLDDRMRREEMHSLDALLRGRRVRLLVPHEDPARFAAQIDCLRAAVAAPVAVLPGG